MRSRSGEGNLGSARSVDSAFDVSRLSVFALAERAEALLSSQRRLAWKQLQTLPDADTNPVLGVVKYLDLRMYTQERSLVARALSNPHISGVESFECWQNSHGEALVQGMTDSWRRARSGPVMRKERGQIGGSQRRSVTPSSTVPASSGSVDEPSSTRSPKLRAQVAARRRAPFQPADLIGTRIRGRGLRRPYVSFRGSALVGLRRAHVLSALASRCRGGAGGRRSRCRRRRRRRARRPPRWSRRWR